MDDDRRYSLIAKINMTFTPGAPIDSKDLFAGRKRQRERLISTIFQKGEHAILYGERGVGKTSLANTLFDFLVFMGEFKYYRAKVNCASDMSFEDIWRSIYKQLVFTNGDGASTTVDEVLPENPNSENIRETFQIFGERSIIIIDELDKVADRAVIRKISDTIKTLSDNRIDTTLILVGVGDSIEQLLGEHPSIERNIVQVLMRRMPKSELLEIMEKGLAKCEGMTMSSETKGRIADYSQGLPFYTHLLARESALNAVRADRTNIEMVDLEEAIQEAVDNQLETNLTEYNRAVSAPRGKNFKPVLLACALAEKNEQQWFYAKDVVKPLRRIITEKQYDVPAFAKHLKAFCEDTRGHILERRGPPRRVQYRFVRPLMGPYVVLRGLADGLINESQLSHLSPTSTVPEQLSLLSYDVEPESKP
jgi:Cdc6-like AAA superfamily ATPase